jgi:hypothetical protein
MNSPMTGLRVASTIFGLVCLGQLTRFVLHLEVMVAGHHIPVWWSAVAALITALLCGWLGKLSTLREAAGT